MNTPPRFPLPAGSMKTEKKENHEPKYSGRGDTSERVKVTYRVECPGRVLQIERGGPQFNDQSNYSEYHNVVLIRLTGSEQRHEINRVAQKCLVPRPQCQKQQRENVPAVF